MRNQTLTSRRLAAVSALLVALMQPLTAAGTAPAQQSVTVAWDQNPEADVTGYIVHLGTSSGSYAHVQDVGHVLSAQLGGLAASTTYYCSVQAYNAAGLRSDMSAEVPFTTHSPSEHQFYEWAKTAGLTGDAALPNAAPFGDGVANLLRYAFNMTPGAPDLRLMSDSTGTEGLPRFSLAPPVFSAEFVRRKNSGLVYTPQISKDLVTFTPMAGTTSVEPINTDWERVTVRHTYDPKSTPRLFGKVEVILP